MQAIRLPSVLFALTAAVAAQGYLELPATATPSAELPDYNLRPFMQTNARVQMFFDATEVGASNALLDELALRYDGPIPQVGAPGPFTIQRLQIRVGVTTVATPGATFAANLSQPLTTAFDGPWTYYPDPGTAFPHPWGAPNNSLAFPFTNPVPVSIPAGGLLVIELVMDGNNIAQFGFSHAIVDGVRTTGGPQNGTAANYGTGCSAGSGLPTATIGTTGTLAPGAAFFWNGQNLGANAPVFAFLGLSNTTGGLGNLPYPLPGTSCSFLASFDWYTLLLADGTGTIANDTQAAALAVPPTPSLGGLVLYSQMLAYVPGANAFDFVLTDGRQLALGTLTAPGRRTFAVSHGASSTAAIADKVEAFGYAVRLHYR